MRSTEQCASDTFPDGELSPYAGFHHARFIDADVPQHVISRVFQGRHLLRPCAELNNLIAGIIGRAQELYPNALLYAFAFMSNHMHLMVRGNAADVPAFVGFIKREISRRWGGRPDIDWPGSMWHEYQATALPTAESQVHCLKYILSQGVKEGLVARPQDWPGVHCALPLLLRTKLKGQWLNSTRYSRALQAESRKRKPGRVEKADYTTHYSIELAVIPAWAEMSDDERLAQLCEMAREIEEVGRVARGGRPPLGAAEVCRVPLERRTSLPPQPWFNKRRRMVCWASLAEPETRAYLRRYWDFQGAFRIAVFDSRAIENYPPGAFAPGQLRDVA